jgi:hypothetical protein
MGDNKKYRKQILGHEKQIIIHEEKKLIEYKKPVPNMERIRHWESEINTFRNNIEDLLRKLEK